MIDNQERPRLVRPPATMLAEAEAFELRAIESGPPLPGNAEVIGIGLAGKADARDEPTFRRNAELLQLRARRDAADPGLVLELPEHTLHDALGLADGVEKRRGSLRRKAELACFA